MNQQKHYEAPQVPNHGDYLCSEDKDKKRTGNVWTATANIITAVIGSDVFILPWAMAQLGWIAGPALILCFSFVNFYISVLLVDCYRTGDPINGKRNHTYMDAVRSNLGGTKAVASGIVQYVYLYALLVYQTLDASKSMKSPPSEAKTMKKANLYSVIVLTLLYMLCGCLGYAAFGNESPVNIITDLSFHHPFWLLNIANAAIVVETIGTYQVYCQPLFAFIEKWTAKRWPQSKLITKTIKLPNKGSHPYKLNLFRLVERTVVVILATITAMLVLPFYDDAVGFFAALSFCFLSVYIPIEMYIAQKRIPRWSTKWICLQTVSLAGLIVSIASAIGSIAYTVIQLKDYKPFSSSND
ncbi:hypothetical protein Sjap_021729 [Stephania japonica]|uniref:Amino acid transporter transmembrane domain-containing protein n=1 Tax=Stephania japonica TaxID=461633 RepID=A0AAP0EQN5_9MAGN